MEASIPRSHFALLTDAVELSCTFQNASRLTVTNIRVDFEVRKRNPLKERKKKKLQKRLLVHSFKKGSLLHVNTEEYNRSFSWDSRLPPIPPSNEEKKKNPFSFSFAGPKESFVDENFTGVLRVPVPRGSCGTIDGKNDAFSISALS